MISRKFITAISLLIVSGVMAQEFTLGGFSYRRNSEVEAKEMEDYNIALGDLLLQIRYIGGLEYNDNVNRTYDSGYFDAEDATLLHNGIAVDADWALTPDLHLSGGLFLEYVWAISGDGNDGFFISGTDLFGEQTAGVDFDYLVDDRHMLTIGDHITRSQDMIDLAFFQTNADFTYWENVLHAQWEYQMTPLVAFALRGERVDGWAREDDFDYLDRTEEAVLAKVNWQANPQLTIQPFVNFRQTEFDNYIFPENATKVRINGNNDADELEIGVAAEQQLSDTLVLSGELGWEWFDFDTTHRLKASTAEVDGLFGKVKLAHEATPAFKHSIEFSADRKVAFHPDSNWRLEYETAYRFNWQFNPVWTLQSELAWTHNVESDAGEEGDLYSQAFALQYQVNPKATLAFWFRHREKDSDLEPREYDQNQLGLQWTYKF